MSLSLRQRLLSIEDDFVSALVKGGDALVAFENRWEALLEDVESASQTGLDNELLAIAHATSMRLAALADTSVELFDSYNEITSQLVDQVDELIGELSLTDYPSSQTINRHSWSESAPTIHSVSESLYPLPESTPRKRRRNSSSDSEIPVQATKRRRVSCIPLPSKKRGASKLSRSSPCHKPRLSSPVPGPVYTYSAIATTTSPPQLPSLPPVVRASRKRRLSDVDIPATSQPCKRLYVGPRLHAVSDTFLASPFESSASSPNATLLSGVDLEAPTISFPPVDDLQSLDVLATTTDAQKTLVNLDTAGGFDICPFFSYSQDPIASVLESKSLDSFFQSVISPSTPPAASPTAPFLHTVTWPLGEGDDTFSSRFIGSPGSTPSPASTPSCPATPLLGDNLELQIPLHRSDFDLQLPLWTDGPLLDPFAITINEPFKSDVGKDMASSIATDIAPIDLPDWTSTIARSLDSSYITPSQDYNPSPDTRDMLSNHFMSAVTIPEASAH